MNVKDRAEEMIHLEQCNCNCHVLLSTKNIGEIFGVSFLFYICCLYCIVLTVMSQEWKCIRPSIIFEPKNSEGVDGDDDYLY